MPIKPRSVKTALERAKDLPSETLLEEGEHWFAVATPWWKQFQASRPANTAPSVHNEPLIDVLLSSKTRKVAVLKPELEEGTDFVFVPEAAWLEIVHELGFDWEVRREVIYQRSQQELLVEAYPFAFKLVDDVGRMVVVLGSRAHSLGVLLGEIWLVAPEDFRSHFPQFLSGICPSSTLKPTASNTQIRVCYRTSRPGDEEPTWTPTEKLVKRRRPVSTTSRLKPRATKRQARGVDTENSDGESSEAEFDEHADQLDGDRCGLGESSNVKLGDLRLDGRSQFAHGALRLHELLVEQRSAPRGAQARGPQSQLEWPSQGRELRWRLGLTRGHALDALDTTNRWFEARVLTARRNKVQVHYRGWEAKWDEWIPRTSPRIMPPHSHVRRWRGELRAGDMVQVGLQIPGFRHVKWRPAQVLEVGPKADDQNGDEKLVANPQWPDDDGSTRLRVHVQVDGDDMWLPADDNLLCQPSTHYVSKPLTPKERCVLANDEPLDTSDVVNDEEEAEPDDDGEAEADDGEEAEAGDGDDDSALGVVDDDGSSLPPSRPPRMTSAVVAASGRQTRLDLNPRRGVNRSLNASFSQCEPSLSAVVKEVVEMAKFRNPKLADKEVVLKCTRNVSRCINSGCKANFLEQGRRRSEGHAGTAQERTEGEARSETAESISARSTLTPDSASNQARRKNSEMATLPLDDWLVVSDSDGGAAPDAAGAVTRQASGRCEGCGRGFPPAEASQKAMEPAGHAAVEEERMYLFQLLVWNTDLEKPVEPLAGSHSSLTLMIPAKSTLEELLRTVRVTIRAQPHLRALFPAVTGENVGEIVQVCYRTDEGAPWMPLSATKGAGNGSYKGGSGGFQSMRSRQAVAKNITVDELQLTPRESQSGKENLNDLLVEGRFEAQSGEELTDWRHSKFYTDIQADAWRFQLQIDQLIDAMDTDKKWYESRVVDMDTCRVKVHYRGWTVKWDEWLDRTSVRIAPLHMMVANWRAFQTGDKVLVGKEVARKNYPEWRNAHVAACESSKEGGTLRIQVEVDGCKTWMDAQDELLCPMGTHKAVNAKTKAAANVKYNAAVVAPQTLSASSSSSSSSSSSPSPGLFGGQLRSSQCDVESTQHLLRGMEIADGESWCMVATDDDCEESGPDAASEVDATRHTEDASEESGTDDYSECSLTDDDEETIDADEWALPEENDGAVESGGAFEVVELQENAWRFQLKTGQLVDALDTDMKWYESRVVDMDDQRVKVHYRSWTPKWDEWINRISPRIAPLHTKVPNWRDFEVNDEIMVGREVPDKNYPEWRNARVTACEVCGSDGTLRIEVNVDGNKQWMYAQDELLCPVGTHKAANASAKA
ncbi:hypothetical protein BBJ28_00005308 [Nothophytophthora sp. Chile5]|nr:hypothetical protein BBJ28_00005308 [Nothophytophthora sp. Chile5]